MIGQCRSRSAYLLRTVPDPKRRLRGWSITPVGVVLLGVLVAAAVTAVVTSQGAQIVAFFVIVASLAILVGGGLSGGPNWTTGKSLGDRRAEFGPRRRRSLARASTGADPEDAWRRERERRAQAAVARPPTGKRPLDIGLD